LISGARRKTRTRRRDEDSDKMTHPFIFDYSRL